MENHDRDSDIIADCLTALGVRQACLANERLPGGISGSHTYRLDLADYQAVLKVTLTASEPFILQRVQRELAFYRMFAAQVPTRVPEVLASCANEAFACCLLLTAYDAVSPPHLWKEADFLEVAEQLADLHARFWDQATELLSAYPWLPVPPEQISDVKIQQAAEAWLALADEVRFGQLLGSPQQQRLCDLLSRIPEFGASLLSLPLTLCHGDCHIGNLLRDTQGYLVWADWQEVRLGRGPEDLSFLQQRARADGAQVPDTMVNAYQARLEAALGRSIPIAAVRRVLFASELQTSLVEWPHYLGWSSAEQVANILERIEFLVTELSFGS